MPSVLAGSPAGGRIPQVSDPGMAVQVSEWVLCLGILVLTLHSADLAHPHSRGGRREGDAWKEKV